MESESSASTRTGIRPQDSTAPATATNVTAGMYTGSPTAGRVEISASLSASVQLCTARAWPAPRRPATVRSRREAMLSVSVWYRNRTWCSITFRSSDMSDQSR